MRYPKLSIGVVLGATFASIVVGHYWGENCREVVADSSTGGDATGQIAQSPSKPLQGTVAVPHKSQDPSKRVRAGAPPREVSPGVSAFYDAQTARILRTKTGEVVVRLDNDAAVAALTSVASSYGATVTPGRRPGVYRIQGVTKDFNDALNELRSLDGVKYAEPNFIGKASEISAPGEVIPEQAALVKSLGLEKAWATSHGEGVTVAVLDSGVDLKHPNLSAGIVPGYDYVNGDNDPQDDNGHGTACAGIVAGRNSDVTRVLGIAPAARIMPIKVLDNHANGSYFDVADGVDWAVDHGAKVVLLALGGYAQSQYLADAVARARKHNVVVVASAGNGGNSSPMYPAAIEGVLSVGALDSWNSVADYSSTGETVDLFAPGEGIWTTHLGQPNGGFKGSSAAAAVAAGVAALAAARQPGRRGDAVIAQLVRGSEFLRYADSGGEHSASRINAGMAFGLTDHDLAVVSIEATVPSVTHGMPVDVRVFIQNRGRTLQSGIMSIGTKSGSKQEFPLEGIRPGEVKVIETKLDRLSVAMHELVAELSADNELSNNAARTRVFIRPSGNPTIDIGLSEVRLSAADFAVGGPAPFVAVTVKNWGQAPIHGAPVSCSVSPVFRNGIQVWEPADGGKVELGSTNVDLEVGEERSVRIDWPNSVALDGTLSVHCRATVQDHRTSNNARDILFGITPPGEVGGLHMGETHRYIMAQALEYLKLERGGLLSGVVRDLAGYGGRELVYLQTGSGLEDNADDDGMPVDVPYQIPWAGEKYIAGLFYIQTLDHFWNPDVDPYGTQVCDYIDDYYGYDPGAAHGAAEKAGIHIANARFFYTQWLTSGGWNISSPDNAYVFLGRVAHLLADMTVPAHALMDLHPEGDYYDNTWAPLYRNNWVVTSSWLGDSPSIIGYQLKIDSNAWDRESMLSTGVALDYLMFSNAQAAQLYASDDVGGNSSITSNRFAFFTEARKSEFFGNQVAHPVPLLDQSSSQQMAGAQLAAANLMPLAIRSTASLLRLFEMHYMVYYDLDLDGVLNEVDNCPLYFNPDQEALCPAIWESTFSVFR